MAIDERKRQAEQMPQPAKLSRVFPTDVSPQRRAQAAMYAPVTNHFSPDAALGALVDKQNPGAGAVGPPTSLARMATPPPAPRFGMAAATFERPQATAAQAAIPPVSLPQQVQNAALQVPGIVGGALLSQQGQKATGAVAPPAPAPATAAPTGIGAPPVGPKTGGVGGIGAMTTPPTMTGKATVNIGVAPTMGRPGVSDKGNALPGAPKLGADGSIQYDDAFAARNQPMLKRYEKQNVVQSVVPAPGVAQSMAGGGTPAVGALARAPQGYTAADRMQQLDNLDRLGTGYAQGKARDAAASASTSAANALKRGDLQAAAAANQQAQTAGASAQGMAQPPRIGTLNRVDPNDAARTAVEEQRVAMEQQQSQVSTDAQRLQLQQAQQMQGLTQQMLGGDKEAAAKLAMLTKQAPGKPITFTDERPIQDKMGGITMQKVTGVYDPATGEVKMLGAPNRTLYGTAKNDKDGKLYNIYSDGSKEEVPQ